MIDCITVAVLSGLQRQIRGCLLNDKEATKESHPRVGVVCCDNKRFAHRTNCSLWALLAPWPLYSTIGYWHHTIVCPSVCPSVTLCSMHCGAQGWCREFKVIPSCSYDGTSFSLRQTFLLKDVSFSTKHPEKNEPTTIPQVGGAGMRCKQT